MISKELLSVVLGIPLAHIRYNDTTNLYKIFKEDLFNWSDGSYGRWSNLEVNIYELAHKCKEWALDNRWIISTMPMLTEKKWRNTSVRLSHFYSAGKDRYLDGIYHNGRIEADTETEAIFKACEWILTKDSK